MIHLFNDPHFSAKPDTSASVLESAIVCALLDGDLKPGDPIPAHDQLSQDFQIPLSEVLTAVSNLLSQRILRQDANGNLFIQFRAIPTLEMRQQAFVMRARQLMDVARQWELPSACIPSLISSAAQQVA